MSADESSDSTEKKSGIRQETAGNHQFRGEQFEHVEVCIYSYCEEEEDEDDEDRCQKLEDDLGDSGPLFLYENAYGDGYEDGDEGDDDVGEGDLDVCALQEDLPQREQPERNHTYAKERTKKVSQCITLCFVKSLERLILISC